MQSLQIHIFFADERQSNLPFRPIGICHYKTCTISIWSDLSDINLQEEIPHDIRCCLQMLDLEHHIPDTMQPNYKNYQLVQPFAYVINGHKQSFIKKSPKIVGTLLSLPPAPFLLFDGCEMSIIQFLLPFAGRARCVIVPATPIPVFGLPYKDILESIIAFSPMPDLTLAKIIMQSIISYYKNSLSKSYNKDISFSAFMLRTLESLHSSVLSIINRSSIATEIMEKYFHNHHNDESCVHNIMNIDTFLKDLYESEIQENKSEIHEIIENLNRSSTSITTASNLDIETDRLFFDMNILKESLTRNINDNRYRFCTYSK
jgi:hypothetical protein